MHERGLPRQSSQEVPTRYDVKILRKDGQERWLDVFLDQIEYEGAPAIIGAGIDITEKKRVESELIESEERFEQLSENIEDVFWLSDVQDIDNHKILFINPAFERIWQRTVAELYQDVAVWDESIHTEDKERVVTAFNNFIRGFGDYEMEYSIVSPDKSTRTMAFLANLIRDENGKIIRAAGIGRDITRRREAQAAVREGEERFRQLSQELATAQESERRRVAEQLHDETGQSLTTTKIQLQMLEADISDDFPELSDRVQTTVDLVELTTGHIRMLARGLRPTGLDNLGLNSALENYCREFADFTELKINYQGEDAHPMSDAELLCFYRIMQEALTNIARHAKASSVKFKLVRTEWACTLVGQDNGRGFSISDQMLNGGHSDHMGIVSMKDRIEILGGSLEF